MCQAFGQMVDFAADDEQWSRSIMDWIKNQCCLLISAKSSSGSNQVSPHAFQVPSHCTYSQNTSSVSILDPKSSRRKGMSKKLWRKSPLDST